jgi:hypothetical protein
MDSDRENEIFFIRAVGVTHRTFAGAAKMTHWRTVRDGL